MHTVVTKISEVVGVIVYVSPSRFGKFNGTMEAADDDGREWTGRHETNQVEVKSWSSVGGELLVPTRFRINAASGAFCVCSMHHWTPHTNSWAE